MGKGPAADVFEGWLQAAYALDKMEEAFDKGWCKGKGEGQRSKGEAFEKGWEKGKGEGERRKGEAFEKGFYKGKGEAQNDAQVMVMQAAASAAASAAAALSQAALGRMKGQ